jgi:DNA-binding NarL/FixJ family response regulator
MSQEHHHDEPPIQTVLVVDDHPVVRQGLVALLGSASWVGPIHEAATASEARRQYAMTSPTLAVIDILLPDESGLALVAQLHAARPGCRFLVLTMSGDESTFRAAIQAGAHGFLVKETEPPLLLQGLRTIAHGGQVYDDTIVRRSLAAEHHQPSHGPFDLLTARERSIVLDIYSRMKDSEIAGKYSIADRTFRNTVSTILAKIGARDRAFVPDPTSLRRTP